MRETENGKERRRKRKKYHRRKTSGVKPSLYSSGRMQITKLSTFHTRQGVWLVVGLSGEGGEGGEERMTDGMREGRQEGDGWLKLMAGKRGMDGG